MFQAIAKDNRKTLRELIPQFIKEQKHVEAIRCYFYIYSKPQDIEELSLAQMHSVLADLHTFGFRMRQILSMSEADISQSPRTQKLLGYQIFEHDQEPQARIYSHSALNGSFVSSLRSRVGDKFPVLGNINGEHITTIENVGVVGKQLLSSSFLSVIYTHNYACQHARAFRSLCDGYAVGKCNNGSECRWLHVASEDMRMHFNSTFRIFLHQVLVINDMDLVLSEQQRKSLRK